MSLIDFVNENNLDANTVLENLSNNYFDCDQEKDIIEWLKDEYDIEEEHCSAPRVSPYEYRRAQVYASGNKWAIENWNATHN